MENYQNENISKNDKPIVSLPKKEEPRVSRTFKEERPAIQVALFILWRIHKKKYVIGSRLFSDDISENLGTTRVNYREALLFLEGAGAVVNEVVITNAVSKELIERYGLLHE